LCGLLRYLHASRQSCISQHRKQRALWPVRLNGIRAIAELTIGNFLTVGIPTDDYQLFDTDPRNLAFYLSCGRTHR